MDGVSCTTRSGRMFVGIGAASVVGRAGLWLLSSSSNRYGKSEQKASE